MTRPLMPPILTGWPPCCATTALDPAFRALVLRLPSEDDMAQALYDAGHTPDPAAIHDAHETLKLHIAQHLQDTLPRIYAEMTVDGPYAPDANRQANALWAMRYWR